LLRSANIANEVAKGEFSEATIGYKDKEVGAVWKKLFHSPTFRVRPLVPPLWPGTSCQRAVAQQVNTVDDVAGVEVCGALKNVVALGAGFCDGLG
jgi:glycerol-3-phosphate dehydrogenase (NAD+)